MDGILETFNCSNCHTENTKELFGVNIYEINGKDNNYTPLWCDTCGETNYLALEVKIADSEEEKQQILKDLRLSLGGKITPSAQKELDSIKFIPSEDRVIPLSLVTHREHMGAIFY